MPPPTGGPGVIWTYDGDDADGSHRERGILAALHDVIGRARRELLLATFSLVGIRDRPELLLDPLRRAMAAHDLDVRLLVRPRNNVPEHRADTGALAELGVTIHGDSDTHAKGVIADGRYGALFSANFDAVYGMFSGVEVGARLDGRPALAEARRYFRHAMDHADLTFVPAPTQHELDRALGARWRRRWPHGARLTVSAAEADWRRLVNAATTGPVLWEKSRISGCTSEMSSPRSARADRRGSGSQWRGAGPMPPPGCGTGMPNAPAPAPRGRSGVAVRRC